MLHRLARAPIHHRLEWLESRVAGKVVLHLGAADACDREAEAALNARARQHDYAHRVLSSASRCYRALDYNREAIERLASASAIDDIDYGNLEQRETLPEYTESFEVVALPEVIEHLDNPGLALANLREAYMGPGTHLLITTPNSLSFLNFFLVLLGRETQNTDHVATYSPRLLTEMLARQGFTVVEQAYYQSTLARSRTGTGRRWIQMRNYWPIKSWKLLSVIGWVIANICLRLHPAFADGLLVVARRRDAVSAQ